MNKIYTITRNETFVYKVEASSADEAIEKIIDNKYDKMDVLELHDDTIKIVNEEDII